MCRMEVIGGGQPDPNFAGALDNEVLDGQTHGLAMCTALCHCK